MQTNQVIRSFARSALLAGWLFGNLAMVHPDRLHAEPAAAPAVLVNVNDASAEEMQELRGVGPALADRIIQYREENGPFQSPDDLLNIRGIGGSTLEKMKDQVQV
jgi:comEA protein